MSAQRVFELKCATQTYAWGKFGLNSEVAKLLHSADPNFKADSETTYAELWMGTHHKGPSVVKSTGETLAQWIGQHPESLGNRDKPVLNGSVDQLPFLFKVLSVNVALSIQVHPDKPTAEKLHKQDPSQYGDDNHKPEMAIALTPFEALCGFRPKEQIIRFLNDVEELKAIVGEKLIAKFSSQSDSETLSECFSALMTRDPSFVEQQLTALVKRLEEAKQAGKTELLEACVGNLLLRLNQQFPGDVGCFCVYFLNYVCLGPGQAMFLKANLPHAYLAGDCLECMACSDNVVRAGLTPKFKDIPTLCSILDYQFQSVSDILFSSQSDPSDPHVTVFDPPVQEFTIARIQLPMDVRTYCMKALDCASIVIVMHGHGTADNASLAGHAISVKRGTVFFVSANEEVVITVGSSNDGMLMFRAFYK